MNYARFFNKVSLARKPSPIRVLTEIIQNSPKSLISMAGGMPNVETFPFTEATITLKNGSKLHLDQTAMNKSLQYSATSGLPMLHQWVSDLQTSVHSPPDTGHPMTCVITNGSQDGLCKAFEAFVSPGDNVLLEHPVYPGSLAAAQPLGCNLIPVQSDGDGIVPDDLRKTLSHWSPADVKDPESDIPKVLYCIPNGGNPTGSGLTLKRKQEIYSIAQQYNLIILEDDPYFYIQFTRPFVPSFLSLDVDGRVLRFDSLSKLLSSGMRIGFVTGPKPVVDRLTYHLMCSSMQASGLSQMTLAMILKEWGLDGFLDHTDKTAKFYENRCQLCLKAAKKHLTGLAEWSEPCGGMFLWLKLLNITDAHELITKKAYLRDVLFVPGNVFTFDSSAPCQYVRASYSTATEEEMNMAFARLAELLKEETSKEN
ncbi:kynurenine/alpha-aminoadipate aminotransferase, mitochondrial-like [Pecten maximus]|uniref:kynurenine/alpha-aminoadipate aminotransferase, mitochondrial-like n=1 Tax=Pecten maximus TaxID=6579 RepID=UPI0014588019|nr:kynurenine/alpha-aminoadipate aminotransferase, mitochondrial-like [Pecten maximus]